MDSPQCENCFYIALCRRAGVHFRPDETGNCMRPSYYSPACSLKKEDQPKVECLSSLNPGYGIVGHDEHLGIVAGGRRLRDPYDASNIYDPDAQEKPSSNLASHTTINKNKRRRDRDIVERNKRKK